MAAKAVRITADDDNGHVFRPQGRNNPIGRTIRQCQVHQGGVERALCQRVHRTGHAGAGGHLWA